MSFNQPPPGPYGSSGQPPQGPYGDSGQQQPQGGGFGPPQGPPQGTPQGSPPIPPQGPPQGPPPGPYGYGAPQQPQAPQQPMQQPMQPSQFPQYPPPGPSGPSGPSGGGSTGKIIAGVAAGVVLVGAIIGGAVMLVSGDGHDGPPRARGGESTAPGAGSGTSSTSDSGTSGSGTSGSGPSEEKPSAEDGGQRMRLTTPKTVDDGAYTLEKDKAALQRDGLKLRTPPPGITQEIARYQGTRGSRPAGLMFSGGYGTIDDPDSVVDGMFRGVATGGATVVRQRETFRPGAAGGDVKIDCEVLKIPAAGYAPVCGWADGSTAAVLLYMNGELRSPSEVDLAQYADTTAVVRGETRTPR
ncbi:hypothetical protein [Streptomyces monomycini]|uniref:hypothetical protein n=1 Tax=Streptomyces monomycini TaxID=371720 RepID=UPI0012FECE94|nr:hypothetical protein [Streptomyces monomycini]